MKKSNCLATRFLLLMVGVAAFLAVTTEVRADLTLSIGDQYYIGRINDGIPSTEADEKGYIINLLTLGAGSTATTIGTEIYDRIGSALSPSGGFPLVPDLTKSVGEDPSNTFDFAGSGYILGKYDAGNAGSYVWYVTNVIGPVTIPLNAVGNKFRLSHYEIGLTESSTTVTPIPGALLLLAPAFAGLVGFRKRIFKES